MTITIVQVTLRLMKYVYFIMCKYINYVITIYIYVSIKYEHSSVLINKSY